MVIKKIKEAFSKKPKEEYLEVDIEREPKKSKILVKPFVLKSFEDTTRILNALREGYTIAVIDIGPLRSKDLIEVKRAVSKIKKTVDALEGDIAGFGENIIIATPNFAEISKEERAEIVEEKKE
jgi:SepF-like predicted cell division protein (DUF552 family)